MWVYSITPSIEAGVPYNFGNLILTKIPISWILYDHPRPSNENLMCFSEQVFDLLKLRHVWNDIKLLFKTLICNLFLIFITFIYFKCVWFRCTLSGKVGKNAVCCLTYIYIRVWFGFVGFCQNWKQYWNNNLCYHSIWEQ